MYEGIIEKIYQEYSMHGFISEDRVFSLLEENNISLLDSDSIIDKLLTRGVIIRDEVLPEPDDDESDYDKGHYNYDEIFNTILEIEPEMQGLINYVRNIQAPQHREWHVLLPQAKNGNVFARNRLFEMYMRSALRIALQFSQKYEQPLADTIQNGLIGLYISIDKFEFGRQDNFPQYYPLWVMQQIRRDSQAFNPMVYYPSHVKDELFAVYDICQGHFCEKCATQNICSELIAKVQKVLKCDEQNAIDAIKSLDCFDSYEEQFEINTDFDIVDDNQSIEDVIGIESLREKIDKVFESLTPKEVEILRYRYGFVNNKEYTLEEIGNMYHVSRERIRQIEVKAIKKLRHPTQAKQFDGYVDINSIKNGEK